jgi:(p)ppGpp synthase/HD superfamily hydrolase
LTKATVLTDRFDRALLYATHVHGGQVRKGTSTPYVAHLLAVAATVLEYGGDEDLAIAALLHDSVEDQGGKARVLSDGSWGPSLELRALFEQFWDEVR